MIAISGVKHEVLVRGLSHIDFSHASRLSDTIILTHPPTHPALASVQKLLKIDKNNFFDTLGYRVGYKLLEMSLRNICLIPLIVGFIHRNNRIPGFQILLNLVLPNLKLVDSRQLVLNLPFLFLHIYMFILLTFMCYNCFHR